MHKQASKESSKWAGKRKRTAKPQEDRTCAFNHNCWSLSTTNRGMLLFVVIISDRWRVKQLIRFSIVGGLNTLFTYGLYLLLVYLGVFYQLALVADYSTGIAIGYLLNRSWTFSQGDKKHTRFLRYVATYLVAYLANALLLGIIVESHLLGPKLGQLAALAIVSLGSFIIQKYWVFRRET